MTFRHAGREVFDNYVEDGVSFVHGTTSFAKTLLQKGKDLISTSGRGGSGARDARSPLLVQVTPTLWIAAGYGGRAAELRLALDARCRGLDDDGMLQSFDASLGPAAGGGAVYGDATAVGAGAGGGGARFGYAYDADEYLVFALDRADVPALRLDRGQRLVKIQNRQGHVARGRQADSVIWLRNK